MFLPVGDSPNLPKVPWVTWGLIAANIAVHLLLWPLAWESPSRRDPALYEYLEVVARERGAVPQRVSRGDLVRFEHGLRPGSPQLADVFSSMFLHAGLAHLLGNMLFLWIFGDNVEHRFGRWAFLLAYLGTGVAAAFGDALLRWGSQIPSVGASGAISGVLGLYFAWFPHNRVRVFVFLFPFFMDFIELRARWVLGFYLIADNLLPLLLTGGAGGVSYGAHIGGFVAGWGLARLLAVRPAGIPHRRRGAGEEPPRLDESFRALLAAGRPAAAASLLFDLPRARTRVGIAAADKVALGEALTAAAQPRAALAAFQRALADHPLDPARARAHLGAARAQLALGSPPAAYQHLYAAVEEQPSPAVAAEARALLRELEGTVRSLPRGRPW